MINDDRPDGSRLGQFTKGSAVGRSGLLVSSGGQSVCLGTFKQSIGSEVQK